MKNHPSILDIVENKVPDYKLLIDYKLSSIYSLATLWGASINKNALQGGKKAESRREKRREKRLEYMEELALAYRDFSGESIERYLRGLADHLVINGYEAGLVKGSLGYRLVYGMSGGGMWPLVELGLQLDPIFNVPVVRGSALKGAFRAYLELAENDGECGGLWERIDELFGSKKKAGRLFFSDMYPLSLGPRGLLMAPDVITPHYAGNIKDEFNVQPRPIPFLAWGIGVRTGFVVGVYKSGAGPAHGEPPRLSDVVECLGRALGEMGVGAKTSVGYGVVKNLSLEVGESE